MSNEEVERAITFLLESQAQLTATVGKLSETVDKLSVKVDRTADSITGLLAIAELQSQEIRDLGASVQTLDDRQRQADERQRQADERQRQADERQREADERQRHTDERLNALINVVERVISGRQTSEGDN